MSVLDPITGDPRDTNYVSYDRSLLYDHSRLPVCSVCNSPIDGPLWSGAGASLHAVCADALLETVLGGRFGNVYARSVVEVFITLARDSVKGNS